MKNMNKLLAAVMALCVILCMVATTALAAGSGTQADPIELTDGVTEQVTVPAGGTVYVQIDATMSDMNLTVNGNRIFWDFAVQAGMMPWYPNPLGVVENTLPAGLVYTVGIVNNDAENAAVLDVTAAAPVVGTMNNPDDANAKYNPGTGSYVLNTTLEAGNAEGYWYQFVADKSGILCVETSSSGAYQVIVNYGAQANDEGVYSNPITYPVAAGDEVTIMLTAEPDVNWEYPELLINANLFIVSGTENNPVPIKSANGIKLHVGAGQTVYCQDATTGGKYAGKGLIVSGYADAIAVTTVTVNGTSYTDKDGNGKIELTLPGDPEASVPQNPSFSITNGHEWDMTYTLTVTDVVSEDEATSHQHTMEYSEAIPACHTDGMAEYWYCSGCDCYFTDAEGKYNVAHLSLVIPANTDLVHMDAVEACHANGTQEYWYCPGCEAVYSDAEGKYLTNRMNLTIPADTELTHVAAVEAGCHQNGCAEYWYCPECDAVFADAAGTILTNRMNLTIPADAELVHMDAIEACHQNGIAEYWFCPECEAVFADAAGTILTNRMNLTIEADTELVHMDAVEPCHANGTQEYWFCPECEAVFADAEGKILTNRMNLTIPADSELAHFAAVAATTEKEGMQEYWYCADCDCYFTDAEGKYNVARLSLVIPKLENPKTGETSLFVVMAALLVSAMGVVAVIASKKRIAA